MSGAARPVRSKYGNVPTEVGGIRFDSKRESERYAVLLLAERAGEISGLECQPTYRFEIGGVLIGKYRPDFRYIDTETQAVVVEDVKSKPTMTQAYRLRKKLMLALHGIAVREVL